MNAIYERCICGVYHFTSNFGIDYIWPNHASVKTLCMDCVQEGSGHHSDWIICCDMTQFTMGKIYGKFIAFNAIMMYLYTQ